MTQQKILEELQAPPSTAQLRIAIDALNILAARKKHGLRNHPVSCLCSIHVCRRAIAAIDKIAPGSCKPAAFEVADAVRRLSGETPQ